MASSSSHVYYCRETDSFHHRRIDHGGSFFLVPGLPLSLCVRVGTWCNFECSYCLSSSGSRGSFASKRLFEDVRNVLRASNSWRRVVISGGEPTFYPRIESCLRMLSDEGHIIVVATNGSRILPNARQYVNWIDVSLHGVNRPTHERNTKARGGFGAALQAIRTYVAEGINVACNIVVADEDYRRLRRTLLSAVEAGVRKVRIERILRIGRGRTVPMQHLDHLRLTELREELLEAGARTVFVPRAIEEYGDKIDRGYFIVMPSSVMRAEITGPSILDYEAVSAFMREREEAHKMVFVSS